MPSPISVAIRRLPSSDGLPLPAYMTAGAAGMDLCAATTGDVTLAPGDITLVETGLAIALPTGYEAQVRPRSGLAVRHGISLPNTPATIDSDYRGEIRVPLINLGREPFTVTRGMRIAQLVVAPVSRVEWEEVAELAPTQRGSGGFGHSGHEIWPDHQIDYCGATFYVPLFPPRLCLADWWRVGVAGCWCAVG